MSIQIGNSPFKQVYIGSTPIKEIYVGSKCVWTSPSLAMIYNEILIPYEEIENRFGNDFDVNSSELTVTLTTNRDKYTKTYKGEDYHSGSAFVLIDNDFVYISVEERPVEAEWVFLTDIVDGGGAQDGSIVFKKELDGCYIGSFV